MFANLAYLTGINLTGSVLDKVRRVIDLFKEHEAVDWLGLGPIWGFLLNSLFPGTSVLHVRPRGIAHPATLRAAQPLDPRTLINHETVRHVI
ncbi:DUF6361 family protein [Thiohalorhabdus denitrificans]|uniref:DUF6361 family protein n=1 Tax=Thiohalorhabdus denitrificans TaxID=381306 RepID=UPI0037DC4D30